MSAAAQPTRDNRTITVDFRSEATYFQLLGDGKAFLECVIAFVMSLGFQLKHKATCRGSGCLTRHSHDVRVRLGGIACRERLHQVAALQYGADPERQRAWCEAALARLFYGEVHGVIWGLQRMKPTDARAAEEIAKLIPYLQRHQERLDYRFARKGGSPMGSGGIESANQFICHVRLKRSGAWWDCDQRQPDAGPALCEIPWHL